MRVKKKISSRREIGAFGRYFYNTVAAPIYPHGCTNAVTTARLYSLLIGGGCLFCCWCLCGSGAIGRVTDDGEAPATSAMWPAVLHGGRPRNEAAGQLTAFGPGCYAGATAEAK